MLTINIKKIPNQEFNINIDNVLYTINLRYYQDITFASIKADGVLIKSSVRCCPNVFLIPYKYSTQGGNFIFRCLTDDYPVYTNFGENQFLMYFTDDEIAQITNDVVVESYSPLL